MRTLASRAATAESQGADFQGYHERVNGGHLIDCSVGELVQWMERGDTKVIPCTTRDTRKASLFEKTVISFPNVLFYGEGRNLWRVKWPERNYHGKL